MCLIFIILSSLRSCKWIFVTSYSLKIVIKYTPECLSSETPANKILFELGKAIWDKIISTFLFISVPSWIEISLKILSFPTENKVLESIVIVTDENYIPLAWMSTVLDPFESAATLNVHIIPSTPQEAKIVSSLDQAKHLILF